MMKFSALKAQVYELAGVHQTAQLKAKYSALKSLDLRRRESWETALNLLQPPSSEDTASEFENWLEHPPAEYQALFSEISAVSQTYDRKSAQTKQLAQEVLSMSNSLEVLAAECQDEAEQLQQQVKRSRRIAKQAELN